MLRKKRWTWELLDVLGLRLLTKTVSRNPSLAPIGESLMLSSTQADFNVLTEDSRFHYMFSFLGLPWQDIAIKEKSNL